jgi:hypothetical protein
MAAHAIPVHRCAELIAVLTGAEPSPGFVYGMLARAAAAVRYANALIRALIITAAVICADETPIRVGPGPKTRKKYLLVARTDLLTYYFPGDRSVGTFEGFVFLDLSGAVIVHDRYQNYDKLPGVIHQLCTACPRYAACPARTRSNRRPGCCWNACTTVSMTSCGSCLTCGYRRLPTAPNETCGPRKPSRKYPGGSAPKPPPATGTPSAARHLADIRGVAAARPGGSGRGQ